MIVPSSGRPSARRAGGSHASRTAASPGSAVRPVGGSDAVMYTTESRADGGLVRPIPSEAVTT